MSVNSVTIVGRLGKEVKTNSVGGSTVANFSVACDEGYTDKQTGKFVKRTEWINCVVWGSSADFLQNHASPGDYVSAVGSLQTRSYDAKDGTKRYVTEVRCNRVDLMKPKNQSSGSTDGEWAEAINKAGLF